LRSGVIGFSGMNRVHGGLHWKNAVNVVHHCKTFGFRNYKEKMTVGCLQEWRQMIKHFVDFPLQLMEQ
jgi:hypothetical protein